jgi:hypothetical protein
MFKKIGYAALATVMLGLCASRALADTIDEQYQDFVSQFNVAKNNRQITSKQASEIDHDLKEFSKAKRNMREAHSDVITASDELKLNQMLNDVAQKLETMTANQATVSAEKTKAPKKK